ncbi:MAG: hypothetical protein OJF51_002546 [Nitrospira sp.]|jgi:hypothetical protein|nr:MAG: hypothetical protein OJF51_002546 [Nitrospira sp.]
MKLFGKSEPRRKSRVASAKHESTIAETAVTGSSNGDTAEDVRGRIAVLAFQLYEQRGRRDGHDVEDWLQAEQRILAGSS